MSGSRVGPDVYDVEPPYDAVASELPDDRFLDRELSMLGFNTRVLEQAEDESLPLLERVRCCGIVAANLDEFFMVRVAGLKRRIAAGVAVRAASGMLPREQLEAISERTGLTMKRHAALFHDQLLPLLVDEGIDVLRWNELDEATRTRLHDLFRDRVFPVLTPLAVDPVHPFPYISGLSLNLAVMVRNPETGGEHFARVKVPQLLPRLVPIHAGTKEQRFVLLEDVIAAHLDQLFPGMEVLQHHTFRVTRNEDVEVEEDSAENLLQALERELTRRRFGPPVRLEVEESIDDHVLDLLISELRVDRGEVFALPGPLDLTGLAALAELDRPELKYPAFVPVPNQDIGDTDGANPVDLFAAVRQREVLLHHPYEAFSTTVQRFVEQAAADPQVLAIKQTLYRTNEESPIVDALIDAAEAGKQVLVVVEIKARFDEAANIRWARTLEQAGCHVIYGFVGLKTHGKFCLVVREESDGLRRYAHIGTGNYNPKTARHYEDLGLLSADPELAEDLTELFNHLSGYARPQDYRRLLVAPRSVRDGVIGRIEREIANHRAGRPARIRIKLNALVDEASIDALYRASRAGVPIDLWTRGMCALRPGVPGLSDTVRVRSVLGRFLEHSRVYWFENGGLPEVWIGSPDLMHRNLDRRLEVLVRLEGEHIGRVGALLDLGFAPDIAAWELASDGVWTRHRGPDAPVPAEAVTAGEPAGASAGSATARGSNGAEVNGAEVNGADGHAAAGHGVAPGGPNGTEPMRDLQGFLISTGGRATR